MHSAVMEHVCFYNTPQLRHHDLPCPKDFVTCEDEKELPCHVQHTQGSELRTWHFGPVDAHLRRECIRVRERCGMLKQDSIRKKLDGHTMILVDGLSGTACGEVCAPAPHPHPLGTDTCNPSLLGNMSFTCICSTYLVEGYAQCQRQRNQLDIEAPPP